MSHGRKSIGHLEKTAPPSHNLTRASAQMLELPPSEREEGRRQWHPTPVLLPGKSHVRRSLVGCSPWGRQESETTERLHFHFPLSCIGEGNGNPLQCSCLENPRDGGAWWAAVYGVAQSQTRLKRLRSSSSSREEETEKNEIILWDASYMKSGVLCFKTLIKTVD